MLRRQIPRVQTLLQMRWEADLLNLLLPLTTVPRGKSLNSLIKNSRGTCAHELPCVSDFLIDLSTASRANPRAKQQMTSGRARRGGAEAGTGTEGKGVGAKNGTGTEAEKSMTETGRGRGSEETETGREETKSEGTGRETGTGREEERGGLDRETERGEEISKTEGGAGAAREAGRGETEGKRKKRPRIDNFVGASRVIFRYLNKGIKSNQRTCEHSASRILQQEDEVGVRANRSGKNRRARAEFFIAFFIACKFRLLARGDGSSTIID
eukprot:768498-Hanusia_phi.AAC.5